MKYHFKIYTENDGFWAECLELDGCVTQADNLEELYENCEESLNLFLEEPADSKIIFPLPDDLFDNGIDTIKTQVAPEIALAVLLRNHRINSNLTQKQAAKILGMKNVYSYQRLERKSNPTLNTINKIHKLFPNIELGYLFQ
jgi:predicted RNase H-like HicB family nuclease/DNA-binding XRE family transcriptional regulator